MLQDAINYLGLVAKDKVTGVTGVVESVAFDLYGCIQVDLRPRQLDKDGRPQQGMWLDINRIELLGGERVMPIPGFAGVPASYDKGPADKPARRQ